MWIFLIYLLMIGRALHFQLLTPRTPNPISPLVGYPTSMCLSRSSRGSRRPITSPPLMQGIQSRPELNGKLYSVVGPDEREGRFHVKTTGGESQATVSLAVDKMLLVVPAEERVDL